MFGDHSNKERCLCALRDTLYIKHIQYNASAKVISVITIFKLVTDIHCRLSS